MKSALTADSLARVERMRIKDDRLREKVRKSDKMLTGDDLSYFRLAAVGYGHPLPPPESGECWTWSGQFSRSGKPVMRVNGKRVGAHLAAYATWIRPVKPVDIVRQACGNMKCVNPCHLAAKPYGDPKSADWVDYHRPSARSRALDHQLAHESSRPWIDHP